MAKIVTMNADGSSIPSTVEKNLIVALVESTDNKIQHVLKNLPPRMGYHFKVEKLNMIEEWDNFVHAFKLFLSEQTEEEITLPPDVFNRVSYFIYFFGSFFKHNGGPDDERYVQVCYLYLKQYVNYQDRENPDETMPAEGVFDFAAFFWRAFPKEFTDFPKK